MVEEIKACIVKNADTLTKQHENIRRSITNNTEHIVLDFCQNPEDARTKMKDYASDKQKQIAESLIQTSNKNLETDSKGLLYSLGLTGLGLLGTIIPFIPVKIRLICLGTALMGGISTGIFGKEFYNNDRNLMGATHYFRDGQFKLQSNHKKELPTAKSMIRVALALFSKAINFLSKHSETSKEDRETIDSINALNKNKDISMIDIWRMIFGASDQSAYVDKNTIRKEAVKLFGENGLSLHHIGIIKPLDDGRKSDGMIVFNDIDLSEYNSIERNGGKLDGTTTQHSFYRPEFNTFFEKYLEKGITLSEFEPLKKYSSIIGNGQADELFDINNDKRTNQGDLNLLGTLITGNVPEKWESNSDTAPFMMKWDFNLDGRVDEEDKKIYEEKKQTYQTSRLRPDEKLSIEDYDLTELYIKAKQALQERYQTGSLQLQKSL